MKNIIFVLLIILTIILDCVQSMDFIRPPQVYELTKRAIAEFLPGQILDIKGLRRVKTEAGKIRPFDEEDKRIVDLIHQKRPDEDIQRIPEVSLKPHDILVDGTDETGQIYLGFDKWFFDLNPHLSGAAKVVHPKKGDLLKRNNAPYAKFVNGRWSVLNPE